jgi:DNA-binding transcriptional LysR family regulator
VPAGKLRISAPVVFAHVVLARIVARFALVHPRVEVELVAEDRVVDPVEDNYDLVIRINPPADELLIGRRIVADTRMLVAPPGLAMPPAPGSEAEEPAVPAVVLSTARPGGTWSVTTSSGNVRGFVPMPVLRLSSLLMVREAVLEGAGAALLPGLLVERDVAAGRLVCWGKEAGPRVEVWARRCARFWTCFGDWTSRIRRRRAERLSRQPDRQTMTVDSSYPGSPTAQPESIVGDSISRSINAELSDLPCASSASDRVTPPPSACPSTKLNAARLGSS